jgi:hypothetical protein
VLVIGKYLSWLNIPENKIRNALANQRIALRKVAWEGHSSDDPPSLGDIHSWRDATHAGMRLESVVTYSVCLDCECLPHQIDSHDGKHAESIRRHIKCAVGLHDHFARLIRERKPEVVFLFQGYNLENSVLRGLCITHEFPFVSFEITARKDRLVWDNVSGITVNKNLALNYFWRWKDLVEVKDASDYCEQAIADVKQTKLDEHQSPERRWVNPDNRPVILFIGQVYTDSSIVFGLRPPLTPEAIVVSLLELAQHNGCRVILKLHPKENGGNAPNGLPLERLTWRKISADPTATALMRQLGDLVCVDFDNSYDTYSMISASDVVVTVNSQAGLESAIRGKHVVTCGQAFYSALGFTRSAENTEEIKQAVTKFIQQNPEPAHTISARIFYYVFFEKYCILKSADTIAKKLSTSARG